MSESAISRNTRVICPTYKLDLFIVRDRNEVRGMGCVDNLVLFADAAQRFIKRALHLGMQEHFGFFDE
jgi:hypothetical protein